MKKKDSQLLLQGMDDGKRKKAQRKASVIFRNFGVNLHQWPELLSLYATKLKRFNKLLPEAKSKPKPIKHSRDVNNITNLPQTVLVRIALQLTLSDLAVLLQLPSVALREAALTAISLQTHEVKDLSSLHILLSYRGMVPMFYRSSAILLFGAHIMKLIPETWSGMGTLYTMLLVCFIIFLYSTPFLVLLAVFFAADIVTFVKTQSRVIYMKVEEKLHSVSWINNNNNSIRIQSSTLASKARTLYLYTYSVRKLQLLGVERQDSKGLLSPWSFYLYIASSCYPDTTYLHIVRCSLTWWFRLDVLKHLEDLVLTECDIDKSGLEIFSFSCPEMKRIAFISCNARISTDENFTHFSNKDTTELVEKDGFRSSSGSVPKKILFPHLEEVTISSCKAVDEGLVYILARWCPNLQLVKFTNSELLDKAFNHRYTSTCEVDNQKWYIITSQNIERIRGF